MPLGSEWVGLRRSQLGRRDYRVNSQGEDRQIIFLILDYDNPSKHKMQKVKGKNYLTVSDLEKLLPPQFLN